MGFFELYCGFLVSVFGTATLLLLFFALGSSTLKYLLRKKPSTKDYEGKVVLITGASSGIGYALALKYAQFGANLVLGARRKERLEEVKAQCLARYPKDQKTRKVLPVTLDVTDTNQCRNFIEAAISEFKRIDVLVLNAGVSGGNTTFSSWKDFEHPRRVMETNYWGVVYPLYFALPFLRKNQTEHGSRSSVVLVSSLAGQTGTPLRTAYAPTKFALHGFEQSLRLEESKFFDITAFCPGYVLTEIHDEQLKESGGKRNLSKFMSAEQCAKEIIEAQLNCDRLVLQTVSAKIMYYFRPFFPAFLMDSIIAQVSNSAFTENQSTNKTE